MTLRAAEAAARATKPQTNPMRSGVPLDRNGNPVPSTPGDISAAFRIAHTMHRVCKARDTAPRPTQSKKRVVVP